MNAIQKMIRLDLLSIKPYLTLKNLIILVVLSVVYSTVTKDAMIVFTLSSMFVLLYASYPFLIGEQNGIESLYRLFGIEEKYVVIGRYASGFLINVLCMLVGAVLSLLVSLFMNFEIMPVAMASMMGGCIAVCQFLIGIQYPVFFKFGYAKAKMVMASVFILAGLILFLFIRFKSFGLILADYFIRHPFVVISLIIVLFMAFQLASVSLSIYWCRKKDWV